MSPFVLQAAARSIIANGLKRARRVIQDRIDAVVVKKVADEAERQHVCAPRICGCAAGQHEPDETIAWSNSGMVPGQVMEFSYPTGLTTSRTSPVYVCRHCRCLYLGA